MATVSSSTAAREPPILALPSTLRIISLNCWGLKFISQHRNARLTEIGRQLAAASPPPDIVGLQECWTQEDYLAIRELTKDVLPHGKFYWSGIFGGGLTILSKWPLEESWMYRYPLNGRPAAFWRGDWYVGKGVACARIRLPGGGEKDVVEVFCTHLHAPYEQEPNDSYICHRTAQAWEIAKLMRHARERGHVVVGLGDFNMVPGSLAHRIVEGHGGVRDAWRELWPDSAKGSAEVEGLAEHKTPTARECLDIHGTTCDSVFNTWRWSKAMRKDLEGGRDSTIDPDTRDRKAKRLDYIFFSSPDTRNWTVEAVNVGMTSRHPVLKCSLSDHFSIETTLRLNGQRQTLPPSPPAAAVATPHPRRNHLDSATYALIQSMISTYDQRERSQRRLQLTHFWASLGISIACLVAVWWSPHNYVSFILMLISTLNLTAGTLDGLMGFLFVKSELRALKEFKFDIDNAAERAAAAAAAVEDGGARIAQGDALQEMLEEVNKERKAETRVK